MRVFASVLLFGELLAGPDGGGALEGLDCGIPLPGAAGRHLSADFFSKTTRRARAAMSCRNPIPYRDCGIGCAGTGLAGASLEVCLTPNTPP